ncbi:hypothetical protein EJ05DRAFT_300255 [Pseudovirgaria hyperparasitica]|uniref:Uncharacterized protein n=1 Tax=Pseudovirgaria hyperparasitica TaxID=470096 RepID=A0A6A6W9E4_9PEZI|nr:uncharacterized protein EJ05DRAFT_300255 [Pseudovirgaria hyperparasitica]KAF2759498.1 hypothetical protein EJ05DRAFT_300255 [Pseudovirgaria hyperparasitica]
MEAGITCSWLPEAGAFDKFITRVHSGFIGRMRSTRLPLDGVFASFWTLIGYGTRYNRRAYVQQSPIWLFPATSFLPAEFCRILCQGLQQDLAAEDIFRTDATTRECGRVEAVRETMLQFLLYQYASSRGRRNVDCRRRYWRLELWYAVYRWIRWVAGSKMRCRAVAISSERESKRIFEALSCLYQL